VCAIIRLQVASHAFALSLVRCMLQDVPMSHIARVMRQGESHALRCCARKHANSSLQHSTHQIACGALAARSYSTCSIHAEENEAVVAAVLRAGAPGCISPRQAWLLHVVFRWTPSCVQRTRTSSWTPRCPRGLSAGSRTSV
jgi:hypothetical protein